MHIDNKRKDILVYGKGPTQWLDDTTLRADATYPITGLEKDFYKICTMMEATVSYFLILENIYQFIAKDSEIKPYPLRSGNISKDFTIDNMKKNRLKRESNFFFLLIIDPLILTKV